MNINTIEYNKAMERLALLTTRHEPQEALNKPAAPALWQVCYLNSDCECVRAETVIAGDRADAAAQVVPLNNELVRIYPLVERSDGYAILSMSNKSVASFYKWCLRNQYAVSSLDSVVNQWEDLQSTAYLIIVEQMTMNPDINMWDLKLMCHRAIRKVQQRHDRLSEAEYHPDWINDNMTGRALRSTYPEIDKLFKNVIDSMPLKEKQLKVWELIHDCGLSRRDAAEVLDTSQQNVSKQWYRCLVKFLESLMESAINAPNTLDVLAAANIGLLDIADAMETYKRRLGIKSK